MTDKLKAGHIAASIASEHSYGDVQSARSAVFGHTTHGKGSHVHTVRGLGLFHDLQEYVQQLEQTAESQRQQLGRLKEEKRDVEKELIKEMRAPDKQPYVAHFQASEVAELPPRLRALFEDNKALKEKTRKYKSRTQELEQHLAQKERTATSLEQQVAHLKAQLQECSRSPAALNMEQSLKQQLEEKNKEYQKLWQKQTILDQKIESDARSHKQALAAAAKERAALSKDMAALKQQLDDKDKEARAQRLEAKQAIRKLEEFRKAAAAHVSAAVAAAKEEGAAEVRRVKAEADSGVHLMLCVVREEVKASRQRARTSTEYQPPADTRPVYTAARFCPEEAATKVQAAVRGHLTRKQLAQEREREQKAAVLIQAGARGLMARRQVQELKRQAAAVVPVQVAYTGGAAVQEQQQQQQQQQQEEQRPSALPMELPASAGPSGRPASQSTAKGMRQRSMSINSNQQAKPGRTSALVGHRRAVSTADTSQGRPASTSTSHSTARARNASRPQLQTATVAEATEGAAESPTAADAQAAPGSAPPFKAGGSGSRSRHRASLA